MVTVLKYCPTNCLSMTEEYELSTYDCHELNYNQVSLGSLPMSARLMIIQFEKFWIRICLNGSLK
ncbi:hypothetical protein IC582_013974 [Cucumis melo]